MPAIRSPAAPGRSRIYEKLIRETAREEGCASVAELAAAVKERCARFRIPYARHEVDDALAAMGEAVLVPEAVAPSLTTRHAAEQPPLSHAEAVQALAALKVRVPTMPAARPRTVRQEDCRAALRTIAHGIREQVQRCEVAEAREDREA